MAQYLTEIWVLEPGQPGSDEFIEMMFSIASPRRMLANKNIKFKKCLVRLHDVYLENIDNKIG